MYPTWRKTTSTLFGTFGANYLIPHLAFLSSWSRSVIAANLGVNPQPDDLRRPSVLEPRSCFIEQDKSILNNVNSETTQPIGDSGSAKEADEVWSSRPVL